MDSSLTIASINCQGLNNSKKRRDVFHYLRNRKYSILFLQDTHFEEKMEPYILSEWGYQGYFSSYSSNARGVGILFNNNFEFKIKRIHKGRGGNSLIVQAEINKNDFLFVNVYGPNRDDPNFYSTLQEKIKEFNVSNIIIGGDFNLVLDPTRDYHNYKNVNNPKAREAVDNMIAELDLNDIWRDLNQDCHRFTWRRNNPLQQARLDFFLISDHVVTFVDEVDIECGYRTDHSLIRLKLRFNEKAKFRNFWKFNSSLLKDKEYLKEINEEIKCIKEEYAVSPYARDSVDNIPLADLQLSISDDLFLDFLLMKIRSKTISYATEKKRKTNEEECSLQNELKSLEAKEQKTQEDIELMMLKKEQLVAIRDKRMEGVILRSKARWIADGEKVSSYFCNLEKRHFISKNMAYLTDKHGNNLSDQKDILNEVHGFYENLYKEFKADDCEIENIVTDMPRLDPNESNELEGEISYDEASFALKNMKCNKSPGTDGFTAEFFKCFWSRLGVFVVRALNHGFRKGELSSVQKEGLIITIPKGDKPRNYIKNWRPLSLLNTVYKIGSSCIANRLKSVLPKLINEDQTGFVKHRYIGDNIRLIYDTIAYLEEHNKPGLLLNIDFEKAFDSVNWTFMFKVLHSFGFQEEICRWIRTFYQNIKSCVIVNGQVSSWFPIERGCRQGDPLSPYLFILCAEVLATLIRENKNICGIQINGVEHKLSQYADDTEFLLAGDRRSFETCIDVVEYFGKISGLKINPSKTSAIWLGSRKNSPQKYMEHLGLEWNPPKFKVLGIWFTNDLQNCANINYNEKLADIKHLFKIWIKRQLTPLGRVAILKSLILSKLIHLWMLLPNPPDNFFKTLQTICYKFIWNNKPDKISRKIAHKSIKNGGLGLPELRTFATSLKLTWLRKLLRTNHKWKGIATFICPGINDIQKYGPEIMTIPLRQNLFWKEVFDAYKQFFYKVKSKNSNELLAEQVFYNKRIQIGEHYIVGKKWINKGIFCIAHFVSENGVLLSHEQFKEKYNLNIDFLVYASIKSAIRTYVRTTNIPFDNNKCFNEPKCIKMLMSVAKGSKLYYDTFIENDITPNGCVKWNEKLGVDIDWKKCFLQLHKISDVKSKWFQIRIVHRCLGTNVVLKEIGILNSDLCSFCSQTRDSIRHMFWQCPLILQFWTNFTNTMNTNCQNMVNFNISESLAILGCDNNVEIDTVVYFIILLAKQYIYQCKLQKVLPNMTGFLAKLKYRYTIEEYLARRQHLYNDFLVKWFPYKTLVQQHS